MATLDELFAEVGLTPPQRTNRNRTVTTPGSYEAPVEGIQDYGAFQRGFTTGVTPGLIEKKKQDIRVDKAAKEFDALKLTELIETSDTDPIEFKKNAALRGQTLNLLKGELRSDYLKAAKLNDTESMNNILSQVSNLSEGITNLNTFLTESQKTDQYDMEASNYKIGNATYTDAQGNKQALTFDQLADVNNNNPEALSYVQKKDKYGAVDTFLTVKNSKYGSFEVNISDLNAAQIQNRLALNADYGTEISSYLKNNPKIKQNTTAWSQTTDNAQTGIRTTSSGSEITDEVDVENRNNATAFANNAIGEDDFKELRASYLVKALKRKDIVNTETVKGALAALKSEEGMQKYADANNITLDQAKNDVKTNVDKIIRTSLENEYLKRTGSYEWDGEKYVKAVLGLKTSTSPISDDKDTGDDTVTGFMEDIFSKFNAATSGASQVLKDSPMDSILEGEDAQNTLTLLRGKKYNGKLITDVKYTKVGEKPNGEPDLRLQVFTQTGDDEIPQKSLVNITDSGSRREFLENIARSKFGSGTTVSKEIAEAYTNTQATRSEVQSVFGIYSDRLRKTLETGKWNDNIPSKYKAAFDAEMDRRAEEDFENN